MGHTLLSLPHLVIYSVKLGEEDAINGMRVTLLGVVNEGLVEVQQLVYCLHSTRSGEFILISCTDQRKVSFFKGVFISCCLHSDTSTCIQWYFHSYCTCIYLGGPSVNKRHLFCVYLHYVIGVTGSMSMPCMCHY